MILKEEHIAVYGPIMYVLTPRLTNSIHLKRCL